MLQKVNLKTIFTQIIFVLVSLEKILIINCYQSRRCEKTTHSDENSGDCCARHFTRLMTEKDWWHESGEKVNW